MSRLYVETIETEVSQVFIPTKNTKVGAVRPHLYIKNIPIGSLKFQICTEDDTLISESDEIQISAITEAIEYHGYVRFYIKASLMKEQKYKFKVVAGDGYSFSDTSFCGVVGDYGLQKYPRTEEITHPLFSTLDFEIWSYK